MKSKHTELGLVAFFAVIALIIRLAPALTSSLPLNDGGLFYIMIRDLQDCASSNADCVRDWMSAHENADYLVLAPSLNQANQLALTVWLKDDPDFALVYKNDSVAVYQVMK